MRASGILNSHQVPFAAEASSASLKRTPLNAEHRALGARMVDFGGWDMPVQYSGVVDEHRAVRTAVGLFDVSHMGEILVSGRGALDFLQHMTTNDISKTIIGQAQYGAFCTPQGTIIDDIIVYRKGLDSFFICVNASNADKDFAWLQKNIPTSGVVLENLSDDYAQIALQGPKARELLAQVVDIKINDLKYYHFSEGKVFGTPAIIARTGYTGELGYELYIPAASAPGIWQGLLKNGAQFGIKPCGLGARDTLRLEMGYLLYGNDMDDARTALECGLGWVTKFDKGNFIGSEALKTQKQLGISNKLVGFEMVDRAIGRHGYPIFSSATASVPMGVVTSGSPGPSVGKNVGMAYVSEEHSRLGQEIWIEIRSERKLAKVVKKPFYTQGTAQS